MQQIDVTKRTIGVNFTEPGVASVCVWAPQAANVRLVTEQADLPLQKGDGGYWQAESALVQEGTLYKISVDEKDAVPDPASLWQPEGVHGRSAAYNVAGYTWTDNDWQNPPLADYILYELHTGTFTEGGTFASLIEKLGYLKGLGITAIEIMPVAQFPGGRNWGYDGTFPFAVQNTYGGPQGLQRLVDACHREGLAVILDVVYNHLGPEGAYLGAFGPYFTNKYSTPWGPAINFDDAWCDGVRRYFIENALMWFRDFHIDALRLDAVHAIKDFSPVHLLKEIRLRTDELMAATGRKHYLIVELDLNDTRYIDPLERGGYGMDAQWVDEFHHALRVATGEPPTGYYADFTGLKDLAKSFRDAYVYDGQWSPHRNKFFGIRAEQNPGNQFIVFSQNHDQAGNRMLGERTSQLISFEQQKLLAAAVILSPYLPMLFMGEEWSEPAPFLYFVSHTDPALCEAVRKGRKAEFTAFHAQGEAPDPVAEKTFNDSKLHWELTVQGVHKTMLAYYKKLLSLRRQTPALRNLDRKATSVDVNEETQLLTLHRWNGENKVICLLNFSGEECVASLPNAKAWQVLLHSADAAWGGRGEPQISEEVVRLYPHSVLVLAQ